jgi:hypothetical protein
MYGLKRFFIFPKAQLGFQVATASTILKPAISTGGFKMIDVAAT